MNAQQTRQDAIRATRGHIRAQGSNPATANSFDIEAAVSEIRPQFIRQASDNQWTLFLREFRNWQRQEVTECYK